MKTHNRYENLIHKPVNVCDNDDEAESVKSIKTIGKTKADVQNKKSKTKSKISLPTRNSTNESVSSPEVGMHPVRDAAPGASTDDSDASPYHARSYFNPDLSTINELNEEHVIEHDEKNSTYELVSSPEVGMHPVRDAAPCAPTNDSKVSLNELDEQSVTEIDEKILVIMITFLVHWGTLLNTKLIDNQKIALISTEIVGYNVSLCETSK